MAPGRRRAPERVRQLQRETRPVPTQLRRTSNAAVVKPHEHGTHRSHRRQPTDYPRASRKSGAPGSPTAKWRATGPDPLGRRLGTACGRIVRRTGLIELDMEVSVVGRGVGGAQVPCGSTVPRQPCGAVAASAAWAACYAAVSTEPSSNQGRSPKGLHVPALLVTGSRGRTWPGTRCGRDVRTGTNSAGTRAEVGPSQGRLASKEGPASPQSTIPSRPSPKRGRPRHEG